MNISQIIQIHLNVSLKWYLEKANCTEFTPWDKNMNILQSFGFFKITYQSSIFFFSLLDKKCILFSCILFPDEEKEIRETKTRNRALKRNEKEKPYRS